MRFGYLTGDPDQMYGGVRVGNLVRAIRDLDSGWHTRDEVVERYLELVGVANPRYIGGTVTRLGPLPFTRDYERGWILNMTWLAGRWPRLPWTPDRD